MPTKYLTSAPLIADIRSLDFTGQAAVVKAFSEMLNDIEGALDNYLVARFLEDCESIDFEHIESSLYFLHLAVNDMDNVIMDYDIYDPMTFYEISDRLDKVMTGINQSPTISKKPKTKKSPSKKFPSSPTPPPHVLKQMEKAIALLNQQQGNNTSLDDFDIFPIELDGGKK